MLACSLGQDGAVQRCGCDSQSRQLLIHQEYGPLQASVTFKVLKELHTEEAKSMRKKGDHEKKYNQFTKSERRLLTLLFTFSVKISNSVKGFFGGEGVEMAFSRFAGF